MAKRLRRPRKILSAQAKREMLDGATCLQPGLWLDREGNAHISLPDILANCGLPATPANMEMLHTELEAMLRRLKPGAAIIEVEVKA